MSRVVFEYLAAGRPLIAVARGRGARGADRRRARRPRAGRRRRPRSPPRSRALLDDAARRAPTRRGRPSARRWRATRARAWPRRSRRCYARAGRGVKISVLSLRPVGQRDGSGRPARAAARAALRRSRSSGRASAPASGRPARDGAIAHRDVADGRRPPLSRASPRRGRDAGRAGRRRRPLASKPRPTSYGVALLARRRRAPPAPARHRRLGGRLLPPLGRVGHASGARSTSAIPNGLPWTWLMERLVGARRRGHRGLALPASAASAARCVPHVRDTEAWDPARYDRAEAARAALGAGRRARRDVPRHAARPQGRRRSGGRGRHARRRRAARAGRRRPGERGGAAAGRRIPGCGWSARSPSTTCPRYLVAADVVAVPQRATHRHASGQVPAKLFDAMALGAAHRRPRAVSMIPEILDGCGVVVAARRRRRALAARAAAAARRPGRRRRARARARASAARRATASAPRAPRCSRSSSGCRRAAMKILDRLAPVRLPRRRRARDRRAASRALVDARSRRPSAEPAGPGAAARRDPAHAAAAAAAAPARVLALAAGARRAVRGAARGTSCRATSARSARTCTGRGRAVIARTSTTRRRAARRRRLSPDASSRSSGACSRTTPRDRRDLAAGRRRDRARSTACRRPRLTVVYNGVDLARFHPDNRARHRARRARRGRASRRARARCSSPAAASSARGSPPRSRRSAALGRSRQPAARARQGRHAAPTASSPSGSASPTRVVWLGARPDIERWYAAADVRRAAHAATSRSATCTSRRSRPGCRS